MVLKIPGSNFQSQKGFHQWATRLQMHFNYLSSQFNFRKKNHAISRLSFVQIFLLAHVVSPATILNLPEFVLILCNCTANIKTLIRRLKTARSHPAVLPPKWTGIVRLMLYQLYLQRLDFPSGLVCFYLSVCWLLQKENTNNETFRWPRHMVC